MNQIIKELRRYRMKTKVIGQIHDAVISNVRQEEAKDYDQLCDEIVSGLQSKFDWLIVPMEIESEKSLLYEDGGNFAEMK
jgi:DNA polymerase I-like protein with 3'-5' exonuclease and polymerase domains